MDLSFNTTTLSRKVESARWRHMSLNARRESAELEQRAWNLYSALARTPSTIAEIRILAERVMKLRPNSHSMYVLMGHIEQEAGNLKMMRENYLKAIEVAEDPMDDAIWNGAITALEDGPFEILSECLERIYERKQDPKVARLLAEALWSMGNHAKAIAFLSMHLSRFPDDKKCRKLKKRIESDL